MLNSLILITLSFIKTRWGIGIFFPPGQQQGFNWFSLLNFKGLERSYCQTMAMVMVFIMFLTGCSSPIADSLENRKQQEALSGQISMEVEIPIYLSQVQSKQYQQRVKGSIAEFRKLYPDVQVVVEFILAEEADQFLKQQFIQQVDKGLGPNLLSVYFDTEIPDLIEAGVLQPLDSYPIDWSVFRPEALDQVRYQGKFYGLPVHLEIQVLCYNKDKVKELPKTLDDLIAQARKGYSVGLNSSFLGTLWGIQVFGGHILDSQGRLIWDQEGGWVRWMEWLKAAGNEPNFSLSDDADALQEAFVQGRLAYTTCLSSSIPYYREALGGDRVGVALLPGQPDRSAGPPLLGNMLLFNRVSSPKQTQIALKLAQFLTNEEQQRKIITEIRAFIPANKTAIIEPRLFPIQHTLLQQSQTAVSIPLDQVETIQVLIEYGDPLYRQVLAGAISPVEATVQLSNAVNSQGED